MEKRRVVPGWFFWFIPIFFFLGSCSKSSLIQEEAAPLSSSTSEIIKASPLSTSTIPSPTVTVTVSSQPTLIPHPSQTPIPVSVEPTPEKTVMATIQPEPSATEAILISGMPAPGLWVSALSRRNSQVWIEFEIFHQDGQAKIDVLEACVSYQCDYFGDVFEAEGCSGKKSPKNIPIKNGKFTIDFKGIMNETKTLHSKLGLIYGIVLDQNSITGTWEIPVCDNWLLFDVQRVSVTAVP